MTHVTDPIIIHIYLTEIKKKMAIKALNSITSLKNIEIININS